MSDANDEDVVVNMLTEHAQSKKSEKIKRDVKLRSKIWKHFTRIPSESLTCTCIHCKKTFSCGGTNRTTHLNQHIFDQICMPYKISLGSEKAKGQTLLNFPKGTSEEPSNLIWKFDQQVSRNDLIEFIIMRELPFNIVEDKYLQKFVKGLNPKFVFVSRNTVKNNCMKIYAIEKNKLKEIFLQNKSRVCLTTDTWTSDSGVPFMALTTYFIDKKWMLHKKIINFVLVTEKVTGENLAGLIINCLFEWDVEKICTITMDNAFANDIVARCQHDHFSSRGALLLEGLSIQVRCWGHIINLMVQDGLNKIKTCIHRVREAIKYMKVGPKRKLELLKCADQEGISKVKMLILDVTTRWNSIYLMLESALHYRRAYERMKTRDANFKDPPLSEDWKIAQIVHVFFEPFYRVTKIFPGSNFCTSNLVFRELYRVVACLRDPSIQNNLLLRDMANEMLIKFNKYWLEKKPTILLSVAFVLDPRYKLKKLKTIYSKMYHNDTENGNILAYSMIGRVENTLKRLFNVYSATHEKCSQDVSSSQHDKNTKVSNDNTQVEKINYMVDFYNSEDEQEGISVKTELESYLEEKLYPCKPHEEESFDILDVWSKNATTYPILCMMARDILVILVSSVASESAFSTGRRVLNDFRSSLLPSTLEALIYTQDWLRGKNALQHYDIEEEHDPAFNVPSK